MNFWKNIHPLLKRKRNDKQHDANYAILNALATTLEEIEQESLEAKAQSSLETATDVYLDYWGDFFGVYRREDDEPDNVYRERIIQALDVPRGTNQALVSAIQRFMGDSTLGVYVYEPWRDIFVLDNSLLDGDDHLHGEYYRMAVIDIHIGTPFDEAIVSVINDFKPAGVLFHLTYDPSLGSEDRLLTLGKYGTIDHTQLTPHPTETTLDMLTPLKQPFHGSISLNQSKVLNPVFVTNESETDSEDVLTGSYSVLNRLLHLAGTGRYTPSEEDHFRHFIQSDNTSDVRDDFYSIVSGEEGSYDLSVSLLKPLNMLYNIGTYLSLEHPQLEQFEGEYEDVLSQASVQITFSGGPGTVIRAEVFNFETNAWEVIGSKVGSNQTSTLLGTLPERHFLNKHSNLYLRLITDKEVDLSLNQVNLTYKTSIADKDEELGFGLEVYSHPLTDQEVSVDDYTDLVQNQNIENRKYIIRDNDELLY